MREFTKSMMSYSWAMSLFGVQQMLNILTPQGRQQSHPATRAFDNVTQATEDEFSGVVETTFRVGDNIQRGLVDLTFGLLTLGGFDANRMTRAAADAGRQGTRQEAQSASQDESRRQATGWGPIPQPEGCGQQRRRS